MEELEEWLKYQNTGKDQHLLVRMLELQKQVEHLNKEAQTRTTMIETLTNELTEHKARNEQISKRSNDLQRQLNDERTKHHIQTKVTCCCQPAVILSFVL